MASQVYLDIYIGDKEAHAREEVAYHATSVLLSKNATIYGLPSTPQELSEEQQDILKELDVMHLPIRRCHGLTYSGSCSAP